MGVEAKRQLPWGHGGAAGVSAFVLVPACCHLPSRGGPGPREKKILPPPLHPRLFAFMLASMSPLAPRPISHPASSSMLPSIVILMLVSMENHGGDVAQCMPHLVVRHPG